MANDEKRIRGIHTKDDNMFLQKDVIAIGQKDMGDLSKIGATREDFKETTIQSLKGAMREGDYGLFVSLSNYTKNAQKYLDSTPIIRGINGTELVDLILKYYDYLGEKYKKMIPLKMVYIPVAKEDEE